MAENKDTWIKTGYEIFALSGEKGLKVEVLANKVGSIASGNASNAVFNVIVLLPAVGPLWRPAQT